jgi:hypothetical protein
MPLYLFDKHFAGGGPDHSGGTCGSVRRPGTDDSCVSGPTRLDQDYWVPEVFKDDLFEVLGQEGRPDYRCGGVECYKLLP